MSEAPTTIDYLALIDPVSPADVETFKKTEGTYPGYASSVSAAQIVGFVVLGTLFVAVFIFVATRFAAVASLVFTGGTTLNAISTVLIVLVVVVLLTLFVAVPLRQRLAKGGRWQRWTRLNRFAKANNLTFSPLARNPSFPGSIFGIGDERKVKDHFVSPTKFEYGNYTYTTGKNDKKKTIDWGYLAIQLDRALPHMVLDARANNGLFGVSSLPTTFAPSQVLALEGDFPEHFTLYCPREYERDALYVFTPDLMSLLIDEASPFDVEVVDKWLFVYSTRPFELVDPAVHQRLLRIVSRVGAKMQSQSDRYVDQHIGDFSANIIAPRGQRLRRGVSVSSIALGGVILLAIVIVSWLR